MSTSFFAGVLSSAVLSGTAILYATVGEVIGERSGIVNLGLEGVMLTGAVTGFVVTAESGNPYLGVLAAAVAGGAINMIFAYLVVTRRGNQLASGLATTGSPECVWKPGLKWKKIIVDKWAPSHGSALPQGPAPFRPRTQRCILLATGRRKDSKPRMNSIFEGDTPWIVANLSS